MNWQGVELTGLRKNREEFPVEVSVGEGVKEGHHIFTGFVRDITERKQAEAELRRLSGRLLRSQDEERRRFLDGLVVGPRPLLTSNPRFPPCRLTRIGDAPVS